MLASIEIREDPDQTASAGAVWSQSDVYLDLYGMLLANEILVHILHNPLRINFGYYYNIIPETLSAIILHIRTFFNTINKLLSKSNEMKISWYYTAYKNNLNTVKTIHWLLSKSTM